MTPHESLYAAGVSSVTALAPKAQQLESMSQRPPGCVIPNVARARESDQELLHATGGESFERFYHRHVDLVTHYVARRVRGPDVTLDVVAETFARALQHRTRYDERRGTAAGWLVTIAGNVLRDAVRRGRVADQTRYRLKMQPVDLSDSDLEAIIARTAQPLTDALALLPADQREAVSRRVLDEDPYDLIANDVGCSDQAIRQRVHRGLRQLRKTLTPEHR